MSCRRLLLLAALTALAGCDPGAPDGHRGDVLVVTIDTARADHFSYAGPSPAKTPAVDELAAEGTAFVTAVAPTPITLPSHASLFTGRFPPGHGVRNNGTYRLRGEAETLAEILAEAGYETAAFVAAAVLERRYGLAQGFGHYDDEVGREGTSGLFQYPRRRGDAVVEAALAWLDHREDRRPTFLWVHLFDPHAPYDPPEPERSRHPGAPYAAEIAFADRMVGRLLDGYRRHDRYREAVIVATADHGESLGEHGEATHGVFVYDATLRVPLVIRAPGVVAGRRVAQPVGLVDVLPTILGLLGLPPPAGIDGVDLGPLLRRDAGRLPPRPAYIESFLPLEQYGWSQLTGVRTAGWKLISGAAAELYDLERDPGELTDLAAREPRRLAELRRLAAGYRRPGMAPDRLELDEATRRQLAALGYLGGAGDLAGPPPEGRPDARRPDPRERIAGKRRLSEAARRFAGGDREGAIAAYRAIVAEEPENPAALTQLADLLALVGRYEEALAVYARALAGVPERSDLLFNRGHCLERLGRLDEAVLAYGRALGADPAYRAARERRWNLLRRLGRAEEVAREARQAIAADRRDAGAHLALALALGAADPAAMAAALERALAEAPESPDLEAVLAGAEVADGRLEEGVERYRRVLRRHPSHVRAAVELARVLLYLEDVAGAREVLEPRASDLLPDPELLQLLAETRARQGEVDAALPLAKRAAALLPGSPQAWSTLGSVRLLAGRAEAAAEAYRRSLSLDPEDRTAGLNLAKAYDLLGRSEEARQIRARFGSL